MDCVTERCSTSDSHTDAAWSINVIDNPSSQFWVNGTVFAFRLNSHAKIAVVGVVTRPGGGYAGKTCYASRFAEGMRLEGGLKAGRLARRAEAD